MDDFGRLTVIGNGPRSGLHKELTVESLAWETNTLLEEGTAPEDIFINGEPLSVDLTAA